ncbi:restriction endonuclease subunit S [Lactococcus lactis]|uniref:restriction endonuclease subunit S n=1 Tax=Lactococcus lactis TaxID=1358 RepID=UPI0011BBB54E|nr:restriction endonuclease subunit S [Lactococcus lactis]QEA60485.1 restriction endonuclease subunit S [Lactococcus lactis]
MELKAKEPKVRFGEFTGDWEECKLEDILDEFSSKSRIENEHVVLSSTNSGMEIRGGRVSGNSNLGYKIIEDGDLVLSPQNLWLGNININNIGVGLVSPSYKTFKIKNINSGFLGSQLRMPRMLEAYKNSSTQGASVVRRNLELDSFYQITINTPSKNEQDRINTLFKNINKTIEFKENQLEQLKESKKTLLSKMFPKEGADRPEIRFAGFTDPWEQRKLGDISDKVKEKNKTGEFTETLTNSAEHGIINQRDFFDKDISNAKNLDGYYVVKNDDFVYNPRISNFAPVGPIKRNKLGRTGVMSPLYYVFRTHDIDKEYFEKYFDTVYWHRFMELNGDSGARADRFAIKDSVFVDMPIPYPNMDEQQKIGTFFKQLDDTIDLHQQELENLKALKKTLLNLMFV